MSQEKINFLASIYNELMLIETSGDNLLRLASIINRLQSFIIDEQQRIRKENRDAKIVSTTD